MILPHNNRQLAKQYFDELPSGDISRKFYEGQQYQSPNTLLGRLCNSFNLQEKLTTLSKFYPHQKNIAQTIREVQHDNTTYLKNSLIFTAVSWTCIFNLARRGYVLPFFKQYGSFFNTHRVYRHYLYTLIGPLGYSYYSLKSKYYTHIEHLWIVHANRLNQGILEDPLYTYYPEDDSSYKRKGFVNCTFNDFGAQGQYKEEVEEEEEDEE